MRIHGLTVFATLCIAALLHGCGGGAAPDTAAAPAISQARPAPLAMQTSSNTGDPLRRVTPYGAVLGLDQSATSGTLAWLGIPYAKPPTGALRWKPPVEPEAWGGTRQARAFGASCAQPGRLFSPSSATTGYSLAVRDNIGKPVGSEDCLTLNVWRPAGATGTLPVIVFIHGGSNIVGYTADPMYDGAALAARANAVVVTFNYRLGLFGWLNLPQLQTGDAVSDSGNFGTLDQIQALRFVQSGIGAFGGDAGNVTVMGESAGAVNVWALVVSPLAKGLMHKAVSMSGGLSTKATTESQAFGRLLLQQLLVLDGTVPNVALAEVWLATRSNAQVAAYLRSKTAEDLIRAELADTTYKEAPAVLTDGTVLPHVPLLALTSGQYNKVPVLAGNTLEEGKLFGGLVGAYKPTDYDRFTMMYQFDPNAPSPYTEADFINPTFLPVDQPGTGWNTVSDALTKAVFTSITLQSMNAIMMHQPQQAWYYRLDWRQSPAPFDKVYGAVHAIDLPFWFGNFGRSFFSFAFSEANKPGRLQLSGAMMDTIGSFAATGNPHHAGLGTANWPNWPSTMVLDATKTEANFRLE